MNQGHERCECHECVQARERQRFAAQWARAAPVAPKEEAPAEAEAPLTERG